MSEQSEARDVRQGWIAASIHELTIEAIEGHLPSKALSYCAEEDVVAAASSLVEEMDEAGLSVVNRGRVADYLLTHIGGDESQPWQAGHNYAMREAARLVREAWDRPSVLDADERACHFQGHNPTDGDCGRCVRCGESLRAS